MRIATALLTLASFGSVFAVAQTPAAGTADSTKTTKKSKSSITARRSPVMRRRLLQASS